jgi:hypothetical protein
MIGRAEQLDAGEVLHDRATAARAHRFVDAEVVAVAVRQHDRPAEGGGFLL